MIKYFIRTTNERILDKSYAQIDYKKLIDLEHRPVDSFIEQLDIISEYDSVLLEDDLILCKDFKNHIEEIIKKYPNMIINFFTYPEAYFKASESFEFMYNQCTYYPKGIGKIIANEMLKIKKDFLNQGYDVIENRALRKLKIKHIRYRPCLIQHLDNDTLIQTKTLNRRSPYFIDYLDELGITYNEAEKKENKEKLINIMNNKFERGK